jgi:hypothetical protein
LCSQIYCILESHSLTLTSYIMMYYVFFCIISLHKEGMSRCYNDRGINTEWYRTDCVKKICYLKPPFHSLQRLYISKHAKKYHIYRQGIIACYTLPPWLEHATLYLDLLTISNRENRDTGTMGQCIERKRRKQEIKQIIARGQSFSDRGNTKSTKRFFNQHIFESCEYLQVCL